MSTLSQPAPPTRTVLVTGSARGLGLAVAREFARRGDRVHVVYRSSPAVPAALASEFGERAHRADLSHAEAAVELVRAVVAQDGAIDVLVHAVGEYVHGPLKHCAPRDVARMYTSNVQTALHALNAARAELRRARGSALFFGCAGLEGARARRETAAYTAAKSALLVLVRSWALEEAPHGVRINMLSPGIVPHEHAAADTRAPALHERIPLGRAGSPEEIARAAAFLCSNDASHTTGADLPVTGGWLL